MQDPKDISCRALGSNLYFYGAEGVPQDYARTVQLLEEIAQRGSSWPNDMLAYCYVTGNGCVKKPVRARSLAANGAMKRTCPTLRWA